MVAAFAFVAVIVVCVDRVVVYIVVSIVFVVCVASVFRADRVFARFVVCGMLLVLLLS